VPVRGHVLTRANALTGIRLLLAPVLALTIARDAPLAACAVFWIAVATDVLDGWVARRFGESTPFGGLIDHAADATFVTVGTAALAHAGALPAPLPPLIAVAFLQYALDARPLEGRGLRASALGRWNGIAYYVAVAVPIMRDAMGLGWPSPFLVEVLGWLLVASTGLSIVDRLRLRARAK
jgi:phosphatidylglycerophosphate synthase